MTLRTVVIATYEAISFDSAIPRMRLLLAMKNRDRKDGKLKTSMVVTKNLQPMKQIPRASE